MSVDVDAAVSVCVAPATPTPEVIVVIVWLAQPLVPVKVKPPTPPLLILVRVMVGSLVLVKVQATVLPGAVAAAFRVSTLPASVAEPAPMPEHVADARLYPAGTVSVMSVEVEAAVRVCVAPATQTPEVMVVIVWLAQPLVPVKVKPPTPPFDTFVSVTVGNLVFVNVQVIAEPAAVAAASRTKAPVPRLGVAVPPEPSPEQLTEASA